MRLYYYAVLGAMGGLIGGRLFDAVVFDATMDVYRRDVVRGALLGMCIGFMIGVAELILSRSVLRGLRSAGLGGLVGIAAGAVGLPIAEFVLDMTGGGLLGRALGWAAFGGLVGVANSISVRSQMWKSMLGGLIGGFAGGALLETAYGLFNTLLIGKFVGLMMLGALIGIFTALIVITLSRVWLEVKTGKLKGTEFILDKFMSAGAPPAVIGSNVLKSDIALPDPMLSPQHARLKGTGTSMTLEDVSIDGTFVNGKKVQTHKLANNELIRMGKTELVYHEKR
jgi:hypothetical protein